MSRMAALFVGAAAVIAFFATASNSSAQQFAVWLEGITTPSPYYADPILTSLDHTFGPGHWTLVSTADLETPDFLATFDTLIMSRTEAHFGLTSISASAAANINAYVGSRSGKEIFGRTRKR